MTIQVDIYRGYESPEIIRFCLKKGLEPKNVDFPGPGAYAITRPWEQHDFQDKKVPFNTSSSRNDKRSFTNIGGQQVC